MLEHDLFHMYTPIILHRNFLYHSPFYTISYAIIIVGDVKHTTNLFFECQTDFLSHVYYVVPI